MDWYVGKEWEDKSKGLHKKVLSLQFSEVRKPMMMSTIEFSVQKAAENLGMRPSKYLTSDTSENKHTMQMGTALTPIDCYLELLLQEFVLGETAICSIQTSCGEVISFELKLERIVSSQELDKLKANELYEISHGYKENGVIMFKNYPKFAFEYFVRAAKLLITYKPFDKLTLENDGIEGSRMDTLFIQIQTNLAACLLQQKRYEDVIYQTTFVDTQDSPSEKSIYRRAMAYYHLKEFAKAQKTIERLPDFKEKREFCKLRDNIASSWKNSNAHYKEVVQRMFT